MSRRKRYREQRVTRPSIFVLGETANYSYRAAQHPARNVIVKASPKNTDLCWVESGRAAVEDECWPLLPGETVTMPVYNTGDVNVLFKAANSRLFVFFDNP
ncbi:MAG: hypothetical protein WC374_01085 [Phycisphaerae bacterium]